MRIPQPPPQVPDCRDALDLPFMHLAVAGQADVLVSGDRDLLALADGFEAGLRVPDHEPGCVFFARTSLCSTPEIIILSKNP